MIILGIETSCDETAVAILKSDNKIIANKIISQTNIHKQFGGVVPEIAARNHSELLPILVEKTLIDSKVTLQNIDVISATGGPGLISGIITGIMYAKTLASCMNKKFISINHLEGHAVIPKLTRNIQYPYLLLLVSGGHCQIIIVKHLGRYSIISNTIDDALGEAFDKIAKVLKIGYPGGPIVEKYAKNGNKNFFTLPRPLLKKWECSFSFSGLKTFIKNKVQESKIISKNMTCHICASFQEAVLKIINYKLMQTLKLFNSQFPFSRNVVISGGVAANKYLKSMLKKSMKNLGYQLFYPPAHLCTDNAVMIAYAANERLKKQFQTNLSFQPKSKWNLDKI